MFSRNNQLLGSLKYFCLFIGYPRSGHSLVGSIIDAHPNACISHELDALNAYKKCKKNTELFDDIMEQSTKQAAEGRVSYGYEYSFKNLHPGASPHLTVIGDKKGSGTTHQMIVDKDALIKFGNFVQLPLKLIHVSRNPYDIITTKAGYKDLKPSPITASSIFESAQVIIKEAQMNQRIIDSGNYDVLSFAHEELISNSEQTLRKLFGFLELDAEASFTNELQKTLFKKAHPSRMKYAWSEEEIKFVKDNILNLPIFESYTYEQ